MSDSAPQPADTTPNQYVAEYQDGPLEGTTEHRYRIDGEPEQRLSQVALVDGTDALFWYVAGERREHGEVTYVTYALEQGDSDPLQGAADPDAESKHL